MSPMILFSLLALAAVGVSAVSVSSEVQEEQRGRFPLLLFNESPSLVCTLSTPVKADLRKRKVELRMRAPRPEYDWLIQDPRVSMEIDSCQLLENNNWQRDCTFLDVPVQRPSQYLIKDRTVTPAGKLANLQLKKYPDWKGIKFNGTMQAVNVRLPFGVKCKPHEHAQPILKCDVKYCYMNPSNQALACKDSYQ